MTGKSILLIAGAALIFLSVRKKNSLTVPSIENVGRDGLYVSPEI